MRKFYAVLGLKIWVVTDSRFGNEAKSLLNRKVSSLAQCLPNDKPAVKMSTGQVPIAK